MNFLSPSNLENANQNQANQNTMNSIYNTPSKSTSSINNKFEEKIIDVYQDNFIKEIKRIGKYLKQYPYIGMDTEFPGIVYPCTSTNSDFYYQYIKTNVDKLKLIQLGITLTNAKGEKPPNTTTWQFNLKFDYENDAHSTDSISLLYNCGINFNKLKKEGISHRLFAEYLTISGMVLNENIVWISFNGFSDFAYLLRLLTGDILPDNTNEFLELLKIYFPNAYDIKYLIKENDSYKGGLVKISKELNIERKGEVHQAGSDSLVTSEVFFKLIENNSISKNDINYGKNIMYGIGEGADDSETFTYTKFAPGIDISVLLHNINQDVNLRRQNINNMNNNVELNHNL
jgi:CCR4-NOT transcription complex subunit 7/8